MIKTVDFGILTKHYIKYQDGITVINSKKNQFIEKLEPLKNAMTVIIDASQRGEEITREKEEEFKLLQENAIELDNEFKATVGKMNTDFSKEIYENLSVIINEWSVTKGDIDMVIDNGEVVYSKPELDITNDILEVLKEKGLYI